MVLEEHVAGLREERQRLQSEVTTAQAVVIGLQEQLRRVQVALDALTDGGKPKRKKKASGSGITTHEVAEFMKRVLKAESMTEQELGVRVADCIKDEGKSLTGYKLRLRQALKDAAFECAGDRVALAGRGSQAGSHDA